MHNVGIQLEDLERDESLEGKIFELYNKTPGREFKSHVQFIRAECLRDAEDAAIEVDPDYWRTKSVRPVKIDYVWEMFTQLYYSYSMAKSVLGLTDLLDE